MNELIAAAREAAKKSYSPYSHYPVGAALRSSDGTVFTGCNIENASYGLTMCAERTAIFKAVSSGVREIVAIAVVGGTAEAPASPCGACRQVMAEFCKPATPVAIAPLAGGEPVFTTVSELLPFTFAL